MINAVVGFIFVNDFDFLLLQEKLRGPDYVRGKLNGIGGKIKDGETPEAAMIREGVEETAFPGPWQKFREEHLHDAMLHFFVAEAKEIEIEQVEDEPLILTRLSNIDYAKTVPNLEYLVPMAKHWLQIPKQRWRL